MSRPGFCGWRLSYGYILKDNSDRRDRTIVIIKLPSIPTNPSSWECTIEGVLNIHAKMRWCTIVLRQHACINTVIMAIHLVKIWNTFRLGVSAIEGVGLSNDHENSSSNVFGKTLQEWMLTMLTWKGVFQNANTQIGIKYSFTSKDAFSLEYDVCCASVCFELSSE